MTSRLTPHSCLDLVSRNLLFLFGTLAIIILGATTRGDWIFIIVHILKQGDNATDVREADSSIVAFSPRFHDVHWWVAMAVTGSFVSYFGLGGFLQYYYYIRRRDKPHEWKCQPERFLTPENERHEILMGSCNMLLGSTISGFLACYIMNGGYTTLYFKADEHGWLYLVLSTVLLFILTDAGAYYVHKALHYPVIYRNIHKHHHRYHSPTAFSAVAMHPLEFVSLQSVLIIPMFTVSTYSGSYLLVVIYSYYYGMIDHSGIKMEALWPWQPNTMFHDDHHKYFHVNFGFNLALWDWLHDTKRKSNRIYGEDIFYGKGKTQ